MNPKTIAVLLISLSFLLAVVSTVLFFYGSKHGLIWAVIMLLVAQNIATAFKDNIWPPR